MNRDPNTTPQKPGWAVGPGVGVSREQEAITLALSAVVAELRKGLLAHDIRARHVTSRTGPQGVPAIDVRGMSLGDAAVLAVVLNESAPGPRQPHDQPHDQPHG